MLESLHLVSHWCLPRICICCGLDSDDLYVDLCAMCKENLPWLEQRCYQCGALLLHSSEAIVCNLCQQAPPAFNRLCALFAYKKPVMQWISSLKFGGQLYPGTVFAHLLSEKVLQQWYSNYQLPQVIIPVPLHAHRHRVRGYNQVSEFCIPLAKRLHILIDQSWCIRIKNTTPQAKLDKEKRNRNLFSAFRLDGKRNYKHVALVDDVVTTGSTVRAISSILNAQGVEVIDIWCICRA